MAKLEQLCQLLQSALSTADEGERTTRLRHLKSTAKSLDGALFLALFERILGLQHNPSIPIRTFVIEFLHLACTQNVKMLLISAPCIEQMVSVNSPTLRRALVIVMADLYPMCLRWMIESDSHVLADLKETFQRMVNARNALIKYLTSVADPSNAFLIRCIGECMLANVAVASSSALPNFMNEKYLAEDNEQLLYNLLKSLRSSTVCNINCSVLLDYIVRVAAASPLYAERVLRACSDIMHNPPASLVKSEVHSLHKLIRVLLESYAPSFGQSLQDNVAAILDTLNVADSLLEDSSMDKRIQRKRPLEDPSDSLQSVNPDPRKRGKREETVIVKQDSPFSLSPLAQSIYSRLSDSCLVDLIFLGLQKWPTQNSGGLMSAYRPNSILPYTDENKRQLSQQLAEGLANAGLARLDSSLNLEPKRMPVAVPPPKPSKPRRTDVSNITSVNLSEKEKSTLVSDSFRQVLNMDMRPLLTNPKAADFRAAFLVTVPVKDELLQHIWNNPDTSYDLASLWIYRAYCIERGFIVQDRVPDTPVNYDDCLCELLSGLLSSENNKILLLCRLLLCAPLITVRAVDLLRRACFDESLQIQCLNGFRDLILMRPRARRQLFSILISFATLSSGRLSARSLTLVEEFYNTSYTKGLVESAVNEFLNYLKLPSPPDFLLSDAADKATRKWNENSIGLCLRLFSSLLHHDSNLLLMLPDVYVSATAPVKREILMRLGASLDHCVIGEHTLSTLVDTCLVDAETLLTHVLGHYCQRWELSKDVVNKIWCLYEARMPDVRFLTPVYKYLSKEKLKNLIPRIVQLSTKVLAQQITKLVSAKSYTGGRVLVSPTEFLICLHELQNGKDVEVKALNAALEAAVQERRIFTKEILLTALQQVVELKPMPTLIFRTIELTCSTYPQTSSFTQTLLCRMANEELWHQQGDVWKSFVQFCVAVPMQSISALLCLPHEPLKSACEICPELKKILQAHVSTMSQQQKSRISASWLKVLIEDEGADVAAEKSWSQLSRSLSSGTEEEEGDELEEKKVLCSGSEECVSGGD